MSSPRSLFSWIAVPAFLWCWLWWHLHYEWSLNPQYSYGWIVPPLAAFMCYLRWERRPAIAPTASGIGVVRWILLALLLPIRVVEEANPDWRLLSWTLAILVVGYSLIELTRFGGKAWARHFVFPILFTLVAVPWPVQVENEVVQRLAYAVASAAVEIVGWFGVGAHQMGNVIELRTGFVGVDEACSGVKTLQAAIMASLALGDLLFLSLGRRRALMVVGCGWVFFCNILRATTLVMIAANADMAALERWHDTVGMSLLVLGMAGLFVIAWLLQKKEGDISPAIRSKTAAPSRSGSSIAAALVSLGWLGVIFAGTEIWYRTHEGRLLALPPWQVVWPNEISKPQPIADTTREILRYNQATSAVWGDANGDQWWGFYARWKPERTALQLVRSHSPDICLPAIGRTFLRELAPVVVPTAITPLSFHAYEFEQNSRPLFVFLCVQEDKIAAQTEASPDAWNARGRLLAAWRGQRNLGQRLFEVAVFGFDNAAGAEEAFVRAVHGLVVPASPTD